MRRKKKNFSTGFQPLDPVSSQNLSRRHLLRCESPLKSVTFAHLLSLFVGGTLTIAKGTVAEICIALRSGHLRPALRQDSRNRTASAQHHQVEIFDGQGWWGMPRALMVGRVGVEAANPRTKRGLSFRRSRVSRFTRRWV
ncbi:hypothetical protein CORC01_11196 [Colletotrichum orchidophilum]|uniref:Uncharacterized protein n=1 Tax=Colletotrichum orchidophilum TaxID=1209926 RepID=A0A1G4AWH0_9PEZI|nr:uncharacterized protein CORC01_11196 [Colletotrichum orchidophilum]OHE93510.1 hypothetical protein CORC01_11196 [Colletotrichum orchidophilum]